MMWVGSPSTKPHPHQKRAEDTVRESPNRHIRSESLHPFGFCYYCIDAKSDKICNMKRNRILKNSPDTCKTGVWGYRMLQKRITVFVIESDYTNRYVLFTDFSRGHEMVLFHNAIILDALGRKRNIAATHILTNEGKVSSK